MSTAVSATVARSGVGATHAVIVLVLWLVGIGVVSGALVRVRDIT